MYNIMSFDYSFYNLGRIGSDAVDNTQRQIANTRMANYTLGNYFNDPSTDSHIQFATTYPRMMFSAVNGGHGLIGSAVDADSKLVLGVEQTRSLEKLNLNTRPFVTVPYLGKGSCDPALELQLLVGENSMEKKSVGTIMSKSFMDYSMLIPDDQMESRVKDAKHTVQEVAMDGWVRGGIMSRQLASDSHYSSNARPATRF